MPRYIFCPTCLRAVNQGFLDWQKGFLCGIVTVFVGALVGYGVASLL